MIHFASLHSTSHSWHGSQMYLIKCKFFLFTSTKVRVSCKISVELYNNIIVDIDIAELAHLVYSSDFNSFRRNKSDCDSGGTGYSL